MSEGVVWLTIFVLSVFVGIEVISKVSSTLHTPLMSGANAIHGVILLGAIIVTGSTDNNVALVVGLIAIVLAAVNMVGGFVVTDRMLQMFVRKKPAAEAGRHSGGRRVIPDLGAAALPARRGLLHPRPQGAVLAEDRAQRQPDRRRRRGAGLRAPVLLRRPRPRAADPGGDRGRHGRRRLGARTVQMTQMPQMVALFNGVGGGAAALVALLELHEIVELADAGFDVEEFTLVATAFTILVGSVTFAGSIVTFAKLQELMTSRPVVFPGLPILFGGGLLGAVVLSVLLVARADDVGWASCSALLGLLVGVLLVLPVGGADVPIVISLLNAFTGLTVAASGYVLANTLLLVAGTLVGASGTFLTLLMARAMGRSVANILFGALKGGSTLGGGEVSDRPVQSAGPEDVAILLGVRRPGDHRARATASRSPRPSTRCASWSTC